MSRGRRVLIGGQRRRRGLGLMQRGLKAIAELQKTPRHGETVVHKHIMAGGGGGGGGGVTDHGALTGLGDDDHSAIYQAKTLLTALGDIIYASAANTWAKLAGNTTATRKFLRQVGSGAASAAPAWDTLQTGDIPQHGSARHTATIGYSYHQYVFHANDWANPATGDDQGPKLKSGPYAETVAKIDIIAETAPSGGTLDVEIEYSDVEDYDSVGSWTQIDLVNHTAAHKHTITTADFTNGTIPANRLLRMNLDALNGALKVHVVLGVWRPVRAGTS